MFEGMKDAPENSMISGGPEQSSQVTLAKSSMIINDAQARINTQQAEIRGKVNKAVQKIKVVKSMVTKQSGGDRPNSQTERATSRQRHQQNSS